MKFKPIDISNDKPLTFICGPCVIESEEFLLDLAKKLKVIIGERAQLVFKASFDKANRQSLNSFRGIGFEEGLEALKKVKDETGLLLLTDVHEPRQVESVSRVVDIIQIPAFLCRQTDLLVAAAKSGKPINVKKGQFVSPEGMRSVVKKLKESGAENVMITERGYAFGYGNLIADMRSLELMKSFGTPIIFDATHVVQRPDGENGISGGDRQFVPALARAATAVGIAGVFLEVHPDPINAKSDAATQWPLGQLSLLIDQLLSVDTVVKGFKNEKQRV